MTVPSQSDIEKRKDKLDKLLKGLNEDGSMSEKKLCTQLRTAVRNVWFSHNVKLSYLMKQSYPDMDDSTRTKWLVDCQICGRSLKVSGNKNDPNVAQVDHIIGEHSLKTFEDLKQFAESILKVSHDDLQILCPMCHGIRTYAERYDVTFDEAVKRKIVIEKMNQTSAHQKKELLSFGYAAKDIKNDELREKCYIELQDKGFI